MNLSEAVASLSSIHLVCRSCGAHQPMNPRVMMERHPPDTDIEIALLLWPCFFCEELGQFRVIMVDRYKD